ncbi:uncharacterized protein LOC142555367 isoform X1 [Primulina tabacum]|uniref:uncharacterized protein LOC142555367 isoform X1 n=1 Tax=Primulina tabacum TaxID=48773 RepID=UPI003F5A9567
MLLSSSEKVAVTVLMELAQPLKIDLEAITVEEEEPEVFIRSHPPPSSSADPSRQGGRSLVLPNIFGDDISTDLNEMIRGLLRPDEVEHLQGLHPNQNLCEGVARSFSVSSFLPLCCFFFVVFFYLCLQGLQMLISAYEQVADAAKRANTQATTARETHNKLQEELGRMKELHEHVLARERAVWKQQVDLIQAELAEVRSELESSRKKFDDSSETAKLELQAAKEEAASSRARAEETTAALELLKSSHEKKMAQFLRSWEFKKMVADKAFVYFDLGFNKCLEQFQEAGLVPPDQEEFPDLLKAAASLPEDEEEEEKRDPVGYIFFIISGLRGTL